MPRWQLVLDVRFEESDLHEAQRFAHYLVEELEPITVPATTITIAKIQEDPT